jgi:nitrogen regulatory protein PII
LGYPSLVKLIQCIIQPYKLDVVVEALRAVAPGLTVFEAKGHGRQKGHPILYRGVEYAATLLPKLMIEVVANDNRVDDIVRIVVNAAGAGQIGDGRIFILPVEESYHVRTGFMELD